MIQGIFRRISVYRLELFLWINFNIKYMIKEIPSRIYKKMQLFINEIPEKYLFN